MKNINSNNQNNKPEDYSEKSFWEKLYGFAKTAGRDVVEKALILYYTASDSDTPKWAKAAIFGALGYFICPIDAIPDLIPIVGFSDDLGAMVTCLYAVASCVNKSHENSAADKAKEWFD